MSETVAKAHMLVFSPVTESSFSQQRLPGSKVFLHHKVFKVKTGESKQVTVTCKFSGVFPLSSVKLLTWGSFDLFADKMTGHINLSSSCYEVTIHEVGPETSLV